MGEAINVGKPFQVSSKYPADKLVPPHAHRLATQSCLHAALCPWLAPWVVLGVHSEERGVKEVLDHEEGLAQSAILFRQAGTHDGHQRSDPSTRLG
eukprot:12241858-Alexandrium_andersonii.AAC.1